MSSRLFRRDNCCFQNGKYLKLTLEMTKNQYFQNFSFYVILSIFRQISLIGMFKPLNNGRTRCLSDLS